MISFTSSNVVGNMYGANGVAGKVVAEFGVRVTLRMIFIGKRDRNQITDRLKGGFKDFSIHFSLFP